MKFLHLADLHLGKSLGDYNLIEDQEYILKQILNIIKTESIDGVLIAGDVYDTAVPSVGATNLLDRFLCELSDMHVNTFMISGNHDSDDRLNFGSRLFTSNQIFIGAVYNGELLKQTLQDEFGEINVYLLPFVKASQVRQYYPDEKINNYEDAVRTVINNADIDKTGRNIILVHQFVAGRSEDPKLGGSEGIGTKSVGLVEKIGYDCFDDFDYAALGHIHSPQGVGRDEVRYAGSPLKYSLSEADDNKSVPVITVKEKGNVEIKLIHLSPMRDLRHIKGNMEQLLKDKEDKNSDDFMYVTLTDEDVVDNAMGIFQLTYSNTVKIDYDNAHTQEINQVDFTSVTEDKSFEEIIGDFYLKMYGCAITEDEMKVMKEIAMKAGVIYEAD